MAVGHGVALAKNPNGIAGRAGRRYKSLIQARTPQCVLVPKVIVVEKVMMVGNDANPILPGKELELNRI
jgi:hypothetical protein